MVFLPHLFFGDLLRSTGPPTQVLRLFGIRPASEAEHYHSGEELRFLLEQGREGGTIEEEEHELIENVFEFGETSVREIMVPRTPIAAIEVTSSRSDLVNLLVEGGYSRIPVYEDSLDNIIGVVHAKDLITLMEHRDLIILRDLLRARVLCSGDKTDRRSVAGVSTSQGAYCHVVDEFGSTAGLVTMEDILEELVGEIQDEHDSENHDIEKVSNQTISSTRPFLLPMSTITLTSLSFPRGGLYQRGWLHQ